MAVDPNDPRPQAVIETRSGAGRAAFRGAYTDPALTVRNPQQTLNAVDPTQVRDLGPVRAYDVPGVDHDPNNPASAVPNAPTPWRPGRDPYKVDGMPGQDFFKNQG